MSTSPSWFDQEKFSRLVKKVGPKSAPEPPHGHHGTESIASTSRISLVSKPPSLLVEHRALPALPRRSVPVPTLKALFPFPGAARQTPDPARPLSETETAAGGEEVKDEPGDTPPEDTAAPAGHESEELADVWQKMSLLNEELAHAIQERDQAVSESALLREQLGRTDESHEDGEGGEGATESPDELPAVIKERDEALTEVEDLREQLRQAQEALKEEETPADNSEVILLTEERDQSRRQYADLRKQFETLKQEQVPKEETIRFRKEWEQQIEEYRQKLEERDKEIAALKADAERAEEQRGTEDQGTAEGHDGGEGGEGDAKLKEELASLRDQITHLKDEASVAQRGLALSQKALHQTRDTLREATEGTSLSRHNFDNIKNECAILAQQNTVLQAQNDQLTRDLAAAKSNATSR